MNSNHPYHPPTEVPSVPPALREYLDGNDLRGRIGEAIGLTTVDAQGWPHAALISVGEIVAINQRQLRLVITPGSTTTQNIERTGRATLTLAHEGALWEIRLTARRDGDAAGIGHNSAIFAANVERVRVHQVPYADVRTGVSYTLKDADAVLKRWRQQILALRAGFG